VKDKPIVALIHQLAREFWFYETKFPINVIGYYFLEKYWLAKYRNSPTITVSESTRVDLESLNFKDVKVVPEGIAFRPSDTPAQKEQDPTLIFVGRLKKAKKPDDAIRAFLALKLEIPNAKLWVVGDGYMISKLKEMAVAPTSNKNSNARKGDNTSRAPQDYEDNGNNGIFFFGKVSNEKKLELMSRAHILLVPGVREGWGLVVTEANAMGTPAVAYDIPGLRDSILNHETGVLVQKDDPIGMAIDAGMLLADKKKLVQYSKKAVEYARGFSWDTTAAKFALILQDNYAHYCRVVAESRNSPYPEASQKGVKIK
jgi:glycosyltransferase involved in cell wall biosynthesis